MLEILQIKILGHQPTAKVTSKMLDRIIKREFGIRCNEIRLKFQQIKCDTPNGFCRICAGILKLADRNIDSVDPLIKIANGDYRDVLMRAEYPRCGEIRFKGPAKGRKKEIYLADWREYSSWLNKA